MSEIDPTEGDRIIHDARRTRVRAKPIVHASMPIVEMHRFPSDRLPPPPDLPIVGSVAIGE